MATLYGSVQWRLVDYLGVETSKILYFAADDTKTLANVLSDMQAFGGIIDPLTDAAFTGNASFSIAFSPTGVKNTPNNPGSPIEKGVLSTFAQDNLPNAYSDFIPAVAIAQITNGHINQGSGTPYAAYVQAMTHPATNTTLMSNVRSALSFLRNNELPSRKRRRSVKKATSEV